MSSSENEVSEGEEEQKKKAPKKGKNKESAVGAALQAATSQYSKQLQEWLEIEKDYQKVLKFCGQSKYKFILIFIFRAGKEHEITVFRNNQKLLPDETRKIR